VAATAKEKPRYGTRPPRFPQGCLDRDEVINQPRFGFGLPVHSPVDKVWKTGG
jgi:hypothetical protein